MRLHAFTFFAMILALAGPAACKTRQSSAAVRENIATDSSDLNAVLSELARGMEADATVFYAGVLTPHDVMTLADERVLSRQEIEELERQYKELGARLATSRIAANNEAEREQALSRLLLNFQKTAAALAKVDPKDVDGVKQGVAAVQRVLDEIRQAGDSGASNCPLSVDSSTAPDKIAGGKSVGSTCWYLGSFGVDCDTTCSKAGAGEVDENAMTTTKETCTAVAARFDINDSGGLDEAKLGSYTQLGCYYYFKKVYRRSEPPTSSSSHAYARRFCACARKN